MATAKSVTDNVTEPLKPTAATSYFRIFVLALILGPPYVIGMVMAARHFLSPEDAEWLRNVFMTVLGLVVTGSGGTTLAGALARTKGKITSQLANQLNSAVVGPLENVTNFDDSSDDDARRLQAEAVMEQEATSEQDGVEVSNDGEY